AVGAPSAGVGAHDERLARARDGLHSREARLPAPWRHPGRPRRRRGGALDPQCAGDPQADRRPLRVMRGHVPARHRTRAAVVAVAALLAGCAATPRIPVTGSSALWAIVSGCVDRERAGYCTCPAFALSCCGEPHTPDADVVWARTADSVAIRDLKMCGCPPDFVAGLALPLTRVSGIEDPSRPEGIWP